MDELSNFGSMLGGARKGGGGQKDGEVEGWLCKKG